MICRLYEKQLSSYLDGELPVARAAKLEAHLRVCPHCSGELNAMLGIAEHIRAASRDIQLSKDFDQRVLRAVGYLEITGRTRARSYLRPLVMVMVVLLAMLAAIWQFFYPAPYRPPIWRPQPTAAQIAPAPVAPGAPLSPEERRQHRAGSRR